MIEALRRLIKRLYDPTQVMLARAPARGLSSEPAALGRSDGRVRSAG
jgi:hypothetical protein